jgi:hypothetical protein
VVWVYFAFSQISSSDEAGGLILFRYNFLEHLCGIRYACVTLRLKEAPLSLTTRPEFCLQGSGVHNPVHKFYSWPGMQNITELETLWFAQLRCETEDALMWNTKNVCVYAASVLVFRPVTQYGLVGRSNPEDGRSMFLRNVRLQAHTTFLPRRRTSVSSPLWKLEYRFTNLMRNCLERILLEDQKRDGWIY